VQVGRDSCVRVHTWLSGSHVWFFGLVISQDPEVSYSTGGLPLWGA
jgi:hypothetical protein